MRPRLQRRDRPELEERALRAALTIDAYHRRALKAFRRFTEDYESIKTYRPPFDGRWRALVDETGHHARKVFAVYAIDFQKVDDRGRTHRGRGDALEDYYCFDEPVLAARDGVVAWVRDGFPDFPPGEGGKFDEANGVSIYHGHGEYTWYLHLKKGTTTV